jgi:hypothetical protein
MLYPADLPPQSILKGVEGIPWDNQGGPLLTWLENPFMDWDLPQKIVSYQKDIM